MTTTPLVMAIVNVTPDSFVVSSRASTLDEALAHAEAALAAGADVLDIGGESTQPGATPVAEDEELRRVIPVLEALRGRATLSIDTQKEVVARAAVAAGATIINDVSATLLEVAADEGVGYVAMHRQGPSATMQDNPHYDDVVAEVSSALATLATRAGQLGVRPCWIDPGIGFGKTVAHNIALLRATPQLAALARAHGIGLLVGTSRKRFLANLGPTSLEVDERFEGSLASAGFALAEGATMVRVHDVAATVQLRDLLFRSTWGELA